MLRELLSRIEFGEVFIIKNVSKWVWNSKEDLQINLNRSNPTVEAKKCLWDVFEQDSKQNR